MKKATHILQNTIKKKLLIFAVKKSYQCAAKYQPKLSLTMSTQARTIFKHFLNLKMVGKIWMAANNCSEKKQLTMVKDFFPMSF